MLENHAKVAEPNNAIQPEPRLEQPETAAARLEAGLEASSAAWQHSKAALAAANPHLSQDQLSVLYVRQKYGNTLADGLALELERRQQSNLHPNAASFR